MAITSTWALEQALEAEKMGDTIRVEQWLEIAEKAQEPDEDLMVKSSSNPTLNPIGTNSL